MNHELTLEAERRRLGVRIHIVPLPEGYAGTCDLVTRDIELSDQLTLVERNCTQAHEMGHIALGLPETGDPTADAQIEAACDAWAAELLIPLSALLYAQDKGRNEQEVCEILGVDEDTLHARILMESAGGTVLAFPAQRSALEARASDG